MLRLAEVLHDTDGHGDKGDATLSWGRHSGKYVLRPAGNRSRRTPGGAAGGVAETEDGAGLGLPVV